MEMGNRPWQYLRNSTLTMSKDLFVTCLLNQNLNVGDIGLVEVYYPPLRRIKEDFSHWSVYCISEQETRLLLHMYKD